MIPKEKARYTKNLELIRTIIPRPPEKAAEYMRCHLQCKFGFLRKDHFYRDVRQAIRKQTDRDGKPVDPAKLTDYVFELTKQVTSKESLGAFSHNHSPDPRSRIRPDIPDRLKNHKFAEKSACVPS